MSVPSWSLVRAVRLLPVALVCLALPGPPAAASSLTYLASWAVDPISLSITAPLPGRVDVVHPSGTRAYGQAPKGGVAVFDTLTNTMIARVSTVDVTGMVLDPAGTRLYVQALEYAPRGGGVGTPVVLVIDTATNTVVARVVPEELGLWPTHPLMHTAGTAVYFFGVNHVIVFDTASNSVTATIPLPDPPESLVGPLIHPSGSFIYVPLIAGRVATIDTRLNAVVRTLVLPTWSFLGAMLPAGTEDARLFVFGQRGVETSPLHNAVAVFDAATGARLATIPLGALASSVIADPAGNSVYAALYTCLPDCTDLNVPPTTAGVAVIDGTALGVVTTSPAEQGGRDPNDLSFDPRERLVYVLGRTRLSVIDARTRSLAAAVPFFPVWFPAPQFVFGPALPAESPGRLVFYRLGSAEGSVAEQWGAPGDRPVPADYDGDGRTDVAVWRPRHGDVEGVWFIHYSSDGAGTSQQWGAAALWDVPVPADYDGDGRADLAVWRPMDRAAPDFADGEQGIWYIVRSSDGQAQRWQWGAAGDVPVPADYDGDGRADLAVRRSSVWFIVNSRDGSSRAEVFGDASDPTPGWGDTADVPVPADYDGDGRADLAVWRPATGTWSILESSTGVVTRRQWGAPGDVPVPADYDGDGRADLAVWRPATGEWWIIGSRDGTTTRRQWGAPGDAPIPADYDGDGIADLTVYRP